MPTSTPRRRRSKAWIYYSLLAVASFLTLCTGHLVGLGGFLLFGSYAVYLFRGGRFVLLDLVAVPRSRSSLERRAISRTCGHAAKHRYLVVGVLTSLILLAGCSGVRATTSLHASAPPDSSQGSSTTQPVTTTTVAQPAFTNVWSLTLTGENGYTASGQIMTGSVETFGSGDVNGPITASSYCDGNPQTDAVVPFELSLTNTTSGFSQMAGFDFISDTGIDGNNWFTSVDSLEFEFTASENINAQCSDSTAGPAIACTLSPQQSCQIFGFVVFHDYYSPSMPNGDPSLLSSITFGVSAANYGFGVSSFTGPGSESTPYGPDLGFDLAGTSTG